MWCELCRIYLNFGTPRTLLSLSLSFFAAFSDIIKTMKIDFNPAVIVNGSERIVLEKLKYYHEPNNEYEFRKNSKKKNKRSSNKNK